MELSRAFGWRCDEDRYVDHGDGAWRGGEVLYLCSLPTQYQVSKSESIVPVCLFSRHAENHFILISRLGAKARDIVQ